MLDISKFLTKFNFFSTNDALHVQCPTHNENFMQTEGSLPCLKASLLVCVLRLLHPVSHLLCGVMWEPSMEIPHMLRTLITDPQQYYSSSLRCYATAGKHVGHLRLHVMWQAMCGYDNHVTYTSRVTQEHSQPIARLQVAGYFCIIPRLTLNDQLASWVRAVHVYKWPTSVTTNRSAY
jgi:hypothetical protein